MTQDFTRATPRDRAARDPQHHAEAASGAPGSNGAGETNGNGAGRRQTPARAISAVGGTGASTAPEAEPALPSAGRHGGAGPRLPETAPDRREPERASHGGDGGGDGLRVHLEFDFPSDVSYIERVVAVVIRQCEEFDFPPRKCALNVPVALTEALSNAILRGNRDDRTKQVRVRVDVDDRALVLEVADEGQGFDYAASMRDPTAPENIDREDGRGLYLMQRLMDGVERFNDRGNVVRLTLKRG